MAAGYEAVYRKVITTATTPAPAIARAVPATQEAMLPVA